MQGGSIGGGGPVEARVADAPLRRQLEAAQSGRRLEEGLPLVPHGRRVLVYGAGAASTALTSRCAARVSSRVPHGLTWAMPQTLLWKSHRGRPRSRSSSPAPPDAGRDVGASAAHKPKGLRGGPQRDSRCPRATRRGRSPTGRLRRG